MHPFYRYFKAAARSEGPGAGSSSYGHLAISALTPRIRFVRAALLVAGVALILVGTKVHGQQYAIDGGFEAVTVDPAYNSAGDPDHWTKDTSNANTGVNLVDTPRTGAKCMEFKVIGLGNRKLQTKQTRFTPGGHVVVQYYYKDGSQQTASVATTGGIKNNSSFVDGTDAGRAANWTKKADVIAVSSTSVSTDFAYIKVRSSSTLGEGDYYIDDVAVYDGTAVDETPPDAPTSPAVTVASSASLAVSWTAPTSGVDGGGYLVVRGTSDPTTAPNTNGIYAVGNTVATGQTVVYIGTGTSFTNSGLATGTYYYRVYTFDKAFNYSTAAGGAAVSGRPCAPTPTAGSDSPICAGATLHLYASAVTDATYAWTGPDGFASSAQNPTIANVTTAASGTYSVTATVSGCTSTPGTTTVTVNALPTGVADTLSTPRNTAATFSSAKLIANDTGSGLQITAVTAGTGTDHGTVSLAETDGSVTYTPETDYTGSDSFTYTLSNDLGCTVQVPVTVTVGSGQGGSSSVLYAAAVDGNFVVRFAGIPGETYTVQTNSVSSGPGWTKLGTENFTAPAATNPHPYGIGAFQVTDPLGSSSRYYRTVWPAY